MHMRPSLCFASHLVRGRVVKPGFRPCLTSGRGVVVHQIFVKTRFYTERKVLNEEVAPKPRPTPHVTTKSPSPRHEVHEGSAAVNIPFNPPGGPGAGNGSIYPLTSSPLLDAALTAIVGLGIVFVGGIAYLKWYKKNVLDKIEVAFSAGYDPALDLATCQTNIKRVASTGETDELDFDRAGPWTEHLRRKEQDWIDRIVHGAESGHYFVLLGSKGSGKTTMIFDSMQAIQAEGVAMCDAHPDLEVFRLRLGKALNYEYNEDSQTGLFQRRDPREAGPALDIERALNKLEKVALRCARRTGRPLILILNNIHFFKNDDEGRNMLLQLQQRAESWAASGIMTLVFSTDDFWPIDVMRGVASRMHILSIYDLDSKEALHATTRIRRSANRKSESPEVMKEAISIVGGRLAYLSRVAKSRDMLEMAEHLLEVEKAWLLSHIGLIPDCDDDVMDEQKWSSCSWLLLREFVKLRQEQERERDAQASNGDGPAHSVHHMDEALPLPSIPYWRCRQIMTRTDFLENLDRANIIAIDVHHNVRPDSMLVLQAARDVVEEDGFDELLDSVRERIDEIESLHRTRELTFKDITKGDRIKLSVDKGGVRLVESS